MKLHSTLIIVVSIVFLNLNGMEREYPLDVNKILEDLVTLEHDLSKDETLNPKQRDIILGLNRAVVQCAQLFNEKNLQVGTNSKLQMGFVSRKIGRVHKSVEEVDTKVDRLSDTIEDSSEIAKATIKNIETKLSELNEHALIIKEQSTSIAEQIRGLSAELVAVRSLVTPLNMARSNPKVQTATASPRKTIPLGSSPREPENIPVEKPPADHSPLAEAQRVKTRTSSKDKLERDKEKKKRKKKKSSRRHKTSRHQDLLEGC